METVRSRAEMAKHPARWTPAVQFAVMLAAATVAYWPALMGGMLWDDDAHVTAPELRSLSGLWRILFEPGATQQYYPLVCAVFWLEHRLWGEATVGYHVVNLVMHTLAAWLFARLLDKLSLPGAPIAAWLFLLHPVSVESVAWISEHKNTFSTVFFLLSAIRYVDFDDTRARRKAVLAALFFFCALACKTITATLPAALLVVIWWKRGKIDPRRDVVPLLPFFLISLVMSSTTVRVERHLVAGAQEDWALPAVHRVLLAGRAVFFYLGKLLWPTNLTFNYPRWAFDPADPREYLWPAGVVATTVLLWLLRRRARGPLAAWLLYLGLLFPVLGFVNIYPFRYSYVADHFQYLAILVPIAAAAAIVSGWACRLPAWSKGTLAGLVLIALASLTYRQARTYRDVDTLYRVTLDRNPGSWLASNNLAVHLTEKGRLGEAIALFGKALLVKPSSGEIHSNLADALRLAGRTADAVEHYREAIRLDPTLEPAASSLGSLLRSSGRSKEALAALEETVRRSPASADAENSLGAALADEGRWFDAIPHYEAALRLRPAFAEAENNLGVALAAAGRPAEAIVHYQTALSLRSDYGTAEANLGYALLELGRAPEAVSRFERALLLDPRYAEGANGLGMALASSGEPGKALQAFETALRIRPDYSRALVNLSEMLLEIGRGAEAVSRLEAALRAQPASPELLQTLATALVRLGRLADAIPVFEQAVKIQPLNPDAHFNLGLALLKATRRDEGFAEVRQALRLKPDHEPAKRVLAAGTR